MTAIIYFLVWAVLIALMMRFGCGRHVMGHGAHGEPHGAQATARAGVGGMVPVKAVDPVCGMTVETAKAKPSILDGRAYYFCSQGCREKFEAAPRAYIKDTGTSQMPKEAHHGSH